MISVDKISKRLVVKRNSVITKNLRFDGKIVAGMNCSFLGNIEGYEVYLAKGCIVGGVIKSTRVVVGANSEFNEIYASNVLLQKKCRGKTVYAKDVVRVMDGCKIDEIVSEGLLLIEGSSKIGKMVAKKILAYG